MPAETFIDQLQAYNTYTGEIYRIDFARILSQVGQDYYYKGWASPAKNPSLLGNGYMLDPYQTFEEVIQIPRGSLLIALSTYSSIPNAYAERGEDTQKGFAWNIEEIDSETNMVIGNSQLGQLIGNYEGAAGGLPVEDEPIGPTLAWKYFCIGERSLIKVTLINLSELTNYVQLFMEWAVPTNKQTMVREAVN